MTTDLDKPDYPVSLATVRFDLRLSDCEEIMTTIGPSKFEGSVPT